MNVKVNLIGIVCFLSLCINTFMGSYMYYNHISMTPAEVETVEKKVYVTIPRYMTDWEMFSMALMKVESAYDSTAVSSKGAKGYFQITPIYVKEVNLKHGTKYTMKDVTNLEKAFEIFELMQDAHNKDYDIEKAIILHNGDHEWYRRRVLDEYKKIQTYEKLRTRVLNRNN